MENEMTMQLRQQGQARKNAQENQILSKKA